MSDIRRQTAFKCSVEQVLKANYVVQQGLNPNYLSIGDLKVARVNLIAILVSVEGNSLTFDDGSGQIQVMLFEDRLKNSKFSLGELFLIIGKPREYNEKRFLVPEILRVLSNAKWAEFRKRELELLDYCQKPLNTAKKSSEELLPEVVNNYQELILNKISELDKGDGAPYAELLKSLKLPDAEEKIEELLKEGEIFEVKGKLKLL